MTLAGGLCRRKFLHLAAGAVPRSSGLVDRTGQTYPSQPVCWIVGFPPGGGDDIALVRGEMAWRFE
jgi:tripartite-type tricarboxylate transporter receptor subunit TctC